MYLSLSQNYKAAKTDESRKEEHRHDPGNLCKYESDVTNS